MRRPTIAAPAHVRVAALLLLVAAGIALMLLGNPQTRERGGDAARDGGSIAGPQVGGAAGAPDAAVTRDSTEAPEAAARDVAADGGAVSPLLPWDKVNPDTRGSADAPSGGVFDARVIRSAAVELEVRRGAFERAWSEAQAVASASGGYVVAASRSGAAGPGDGDGRDRARDGSITMRIPAAKFDAAVDRLRDLDRARVERLDVSSQDVTEEFVDVRSRLRHDRAVEGRLLALLARTRAVSEVLAVQARLDQVQEEIEVSRGRLQYLERLTAMGTIQLSLREPGAGDADADGPGLGDAFGTAGERFLDSTSSAIVWLGGALPLLLVLVPALLLARVAWRRKGR